MFCGSVWLKQLQGRKRGSQLAAAHKQIYTTYILLFVFCFTCRCELSLILLRLVDERGNVNFLQQQPVSSVSSIFLILGVTWAVLLVYINIILVWYFRQYNVKIELLKSFIIPHYCFEMSPFVSTKVFQAGGSVNLFYHDGGLEENCSNQIGRY